MKLDIPGSPHQQPLAPEEWTMQMLKEGSQHVAIVERRGIPMCRVSTITASRTPDQMRSDLAEKARAWIADFLARAAIGQ